MGSVKGRKFSHPGQLILILVAIACGKASASLRAVMAIDLGGEFIKIAVVGVGMGMEIVINEESSRKTRAIVAFQDGARYFSSQAENIALKHPGKAVGYLTDILGCQFDDPKVQLYRERFPQYNLLKDEERGTVLFKIDENTVYSPEEILAMLLEKAKEYADSFARQNFKDAVLTVPPFFNQAERRAVQTAAKLAGINLLQLINDNTAVALNYGLFRHKNFNSSAQYYMFFDMGSTSTTATIVGYKNVKTKTEAGVQFTPQLTVVGVGFDRTLGGREFTLKLRTHLARTFNDQKKTALKVEGNAKAMAKLLKEAERVKKVLSANVNHQAQVENLFDNKDLRADVTRSEFEKMNQDLFERVTRPIDDALKASQLTWPQITDVILMGGGTRMPKVQEILLKHLERSELGKSINTDDSAALGAVYRAASFSKLFRVMKFVVWEGNLFPISVVYERQAADDEGKVKSVIFRHVLYEKMCRYPQKKMVTFTNNLKDFTFNTTYSDLHFLSESEKKLFRNSVISKYTLTLNEDALSKALGQADARGIQTHFYMNESGILILDSVKAFATDLKSAGDLPVQEEVTGEEEVEDMLISEDEENEREESTETNDKTESDSETDDLHGPQKSDTDDMPDLKESDAEKVGVPGLKESDAEKVDVPGPKDSDTEKDDVPGLKNIYSEKVDVRGLKTPQQSKEVYSKVVNGKKFITIKQDHLDVKDMPTEKVNAAKQRLADQKRADQEKIQLEKAKNDLEAFIIGYQDKLRHGPHYECSTETERNHLLELLNQTSKWLYEQSDNFSTLELTNRLNALKEESKNVSMRAYEMVKRPLALAVLDKMLDPTFLIMMKNMSLLDSTITPNAEIDHYENLLNQTRDWRDEQIKAQQKLKPYENPILLTKHVVRKIKLLKKEMFTLNYKAKKNAPPEVLKAAADKNAQVHMYGVFTKPRIWTSFKHYIYKNEMFRAMNEDCINHEYLQVH